jgi:hypothetical protein
MALQNGLFTGNAVDAARNFLGQDDFSNTKINFDASKISGLSDSTLITDDGRSVEISSKGAAGAMASVKNLSDSIAELRTAPDGEKILSKYHEVVEMLEHIRSLGQVDAPLYLGVKYKIIDEQEAAAIKSLIKERTANITNNRRMRALGLSDNLIQLARNRVTGDPQKTNLYYHLIAAVAHVAADAVNKHTNFGEAASTILNNSALIQIYTLARVRGDEWILEEFDSKYPGASVRDVILTANKTYSSTGIKGNFTFKLLRGNQRVTESDLGAGRKLRRQI